MFAVLDVFASFDGGDIPTVEFRYRCDLTGSGAGKRGLAELGADPACHCKYRLRMCLRSSHMEGL